jgi:amino acid transporter
MAEIPGNSSATKAMGVWNVAALGIGSMVGAGIFALLGQAALAVGPNTYLAFAAGGVIALLSGYSYARLGAGYPGRGGIIEFFRRGLPSRTLAIALSLLYLVTLALTIAMVAKAFGAYAARLLHDPPTHLERVNTYAALVIVALTLLNIVGAEAVGRAEVALVGVKLVILAVLIVAGATTLKLDMLTSGGATSFDAFLRVIGLTFFAYAGYGMMANAAGDVADPERTISRAFMIAIAVTIVLYVALSLVVLGNVTPEKLAKYADTAVAEAAEPVLGHAGFVIISIGALLATSSAINATLFAMLSIMGDMGQRGELPAAFDRPVWRRGTAGLLASIAAVLAITVFLDLGALANVASAAFLVCYLAVFVCAWRLRRSIGASPVLLAIGFAAMAGVFAAFVAGLWDTQRWGIAMIAAFAIGCWILASRAAPNAH